ncbi:MAG: TIGR04282 family arsenosugar biosynthesis glycosyltransferase [Acidobacteriota bacterium]
MNDRDQPSRQRKARYARSLLLFAKPPVPGRVKTRLTRPGAEALSQPEEGAGSLPQADDTVPRPLTSYKAAKIYQAFLEDMAQRLVLEGEFELRLSWALEDGESPPVLRGAEGVLSVRQEGEDLGARLFSGLKDASRGNRCVIALGSDHPTLSVATLHVAFKRLEAGVPVVLGPAEDGGYYLIGLRPEAVRWQLFKDVPWSTSQVLKTTLARCQQLGFGCQRLPPASDVDTPEDLHRLAWALAREKAAGRGLSCPRTTALLDSWGRLPEVTG